MRPSRSAASGHYSIISSTRENAVWFIPSAKHGVVQADTVLCSYLRGAGLETICSKGSGLTASCPTNGRS
jgi:hypothetical protein